MNKMTERCFHTCINNFTMSSLGKKEKSCIMNCASKQVEIMERTQRVYQEIKTVNALNASK